MHLNKRLAHFCKLASVDVSILQVVHLSAYLKCYLKHSSDAFGMGMTFAGGKDSFAEIIVFHHFVFSSPLCCAYD